MAGGRVDDVADNVFHVPSRINSTWGGNLTDMVRCRRILEVIEAEDLFTNAAVRGAEVLEGLRGLAADHPLVTNPRGLGLMCAVTMPDRAIRDRVLSVLLEQERVIMLGCGDRSLRVRPALTVTPEIVQRALAALDRAIGVVEAELKRDGDVAYA